MSPSVLKVLIEARGGQTKVSHAINCSQSELSQTINGHRVNDEIRERLAAHLGMTKAELFDDEFEAVINYRRSA